MLNKSFLRILTNYGRNFSTLPSAAKKPTSDNRTAQLKQMLLSPKLEFIMEAHSALSAKIVEETGFKVRTNIHKKLLKMVFKAIIHCMMLQLRYSKVQSLLMRIERIRNSKKCGSQISFPF
jgi:hypothetical protein